MLETKKKGDKKMTARKQYTPKEWQRNPYNLTTEKVQYWLNSGTMITAQMTLEKAREMVYEGRAFVISDQAINETLLINQ